MQKGFADGKFFLLLKKVMSNRLPVRRSARASHSHHVAHVPHVPHVPMWRRPLSVPRTWRVVDDRRKFSHHTEHRGRTLPGPDTRTQELWRLTLEARSIPYTVTGNAENTRFFVPALCEIMAREELSALRHEHANKPPRAPFIPQPHAWLAMLLMVFLFFWQAFASAWVYLPLEHIPDPAYWLERGKVDVYRIVVLREWYRCLTALTLHADSFHFFSNFLITFPFLFMLARRIGPGMAVALTLLAGGLGNALNVFYQPYTHTSIGFSTAFFAIVGLLCAQAAFTDSETNWRRHVLAPIAAGLGLLALLGTGGGNTDYAAHIFGFIAGLFLGAFHSLFERHICPTPTFVRWTMGLGVPGFLFWCWDKAFSG